jgi:hypothetical protein
MDLGSLYLSLLILKGLTLQQAQIYADCAHTKDPAACYDSIPSQYDLQDNFFYGDYQLLPQYTPGQFYHYVDPRPLASRDESACLPTPPSSPSHCY